MQGKSHRDILSSRAFYIRGTGGKRVAFYLADVNQVWTNPDLPKKTINKALVEEFVHNNTCRSKPVQLHQVINLLSEDCRCPTAQEYVDFVESIAMAYYPLIKSGTISNRGLPRRLLDECVPYRDLAKRILGLVVRLSEGADSNILPSIAKEQMLFAVNTFLSRIVPLVPQQCSKVLDFIETLAFPEQWKDSRDIFEILFAETGKLIKKNSPESLGFTLTHPRDPHRMISDMFEIFECAMSCKPFDLYKRLEILTSIFPILLNLITFDNAGMIPIYWLRRRDNSIYFLVELWHQTHELLADTEKNIPLVFSPKPGIPPTCGARQIYVEIHKAVKNFIAHKGIYSPYILFEGMLNLLPILLHKHLNFETDLHTKCFYCNHTFSDYKTISEANRFLSMSPEFRKEFICAAKHFKTWLVTVSPKAVHDEMYKDVPFIPARLKPSKKYEREKTIPWIESIDPDKPG